ncbi:MAG: 3-methyladenine DNA glycosylase [Gemmatimonadota bacterium]|nr:3-methyladenine DNA glycosylase [Gemmatimonadota bacterium]
MLDTRPITLRAPDAKVLTSMEWQARDEAHLERAQRWTLPHKERRSRHEPHPVHDFLFQYYMYSPGKLETWHPAPSESLQDSAAARERFSPPEYRAAGGVISRDFGAVSHQVREQLRTVVKVLVATQSQPANFGCYGVHEWAMVYGGHDVRHAGIAPLRLPQEEVDAFIEGRPIACSHFDAYRFFAPEVKPLNRVQLEWSTRHEMEQPGCIHANMDLYRWAYTAMPWIGSAVLLDCFELAAELRMLDMQASPYDLRDLGFEPVRVETMEGRREYQRRQRELSERAMVLRAELIEVVGEVLSA